MHHCTERTISAGRRADSERGLSEEEELSQRWRRAILKLSDNLRSAAASRSDLTPILMDAMNYALRQLLEHGNDHYVAELEEWLAYEDTATPAPRSYHSPNRRSATPRRGTADRRGGDRRQGIDRRAGGVRKPGAKLGTDL